MFFYQKILLNLTIARYLYQIFSIILNMSLFAEMLGEVHETINSALFAYTKDRDFMKIS